MKTIEDWKDAYYEQQARFTESNGMLTQERDRAIARAEKAEARLRRFAGIALAVEGKDGGFGSELAASRELDFVREDFLGRHAQGDDAYTAFCYALDQIMPEPALATVEGEDIGRPKTIAAECMKGGCRRASAPCGPSERCECLDPPLSQGGGQ